MYDLCHSDPSLDLEQHRTRDSFVFEAEKQSFLSSSLSFRNNFEDFWQRLLESINVCTFNHSGPCTEVKLKRHMNPVHGTQGPELSPLEPCLGDAMGADGFKNLVRRGAAGHSGRVGSHLGSGQVYLEDLRGSNQNKGKQNICFMGYFKEIRLKG